MTLQSPTDASPPDGPPGPKVREAGAGPKVICLHANASSSGQWRNLMERLAPSCHVLAPDLYGAGASPPAPRRAGRLRDEVDLIAPLLEQPGPPVVLVGHSYGAAVALMAALLHPGRVRALAVYEPTLFGLIDEASPAPNAADGIRQAVAEAVDALTAGDADRAAARFIDYWMGEGAWRDTPVTRKPAIVSAIADVGRWGEALFNEPTPLRSFGGLDVPVLYMSGACSMESALGVARLLRGVLPRAETVVFDTLGHMGPVTHAEVVNAEIERFLAAHPATEAR